MAVIFCEETKQFYLTILEYGVEAKLPVRLYEAMDAWLGPRRGWDGTIRGKENLTGEALVLHRKRCELGKVRGKFRAAYKLFCELNDMGRLDAQNEKEVLVEYTIE